jgi:negative regulator of replication initiation
MPGSGQAVWVNVSRITYIFKGHEGTTRVYFADEDWLNVNQTPEEIVKAPAWMIAPDYP